MFLGDLKIYDDRLLVFFSNIKLSRWMFCSDESPHKQSWWTTVWGIIVWMASGYHPTTFSYQKSLPQLPVPPLHVSVNKFLASVEPLCGGADSDQFKILTKEAQVYILQIICRWYSWYVLWIFDVILIYKKLLIYKKYLISLSISLSLICQLPHTIRSTPPLILCFFVNLSPLFAIYTFSTLPSLSASRIT